MAGKTWKSHLVVGIGAFALVGAAACGSFKMPEGYGASGLLTGGPDDTSTDTQSQSSSVNVPPNNAQPMDSAQFESLKAQVSDAGMSSKKISLVEEAGRSSYFSAAQVGELVALLDMKDQRVKLVETIADRILDLENSGAVTSRLTFDDERSDVESIMSDARVARAKEADRLAEQQRIAEEKRAAEAARAAEEAKAADEARSTQQADTTTTTTQTSNSSAYCCLNGKYNSCDSGAAAGACMGWGKCFFDCQMDGGSACDQKCADEYPLINQCRADASRDDQCK
ncbi:MAG: DUF4476 domain-containing protein [bacterium]